MLSLSQYSLILQNHSLKDQSFHLFTFEKAKKIVFGDYLILMLGLCYFGYLKLEQHTAKTPEAIYMFKLAQDLVCKVKP